jgi:trigger factor
MNVSLKNNDGVSGIVAVEIEKNDYAEAMKKNLQKLRRKVNMQGFRSGMVPMSIVQKLYGKQAMAEEVNKLVIDGLYAYLREQDIKILGDVIPNETEQKKIDFDTNENFEFYFDVALAPEIDVKLTKKDTLTLYRITLDDEQIDEQVESYRRTYGSYASGEKVEVEDMVEGTLVELADGAPKEDGILEEDSVLMPSYMKGKMEQKKFIGAKVGDKIVFNPYKAYKGTEAEISSLLKIEKEAVKEMKSDFSFEIKKITRYKPAELNKELFDLVIGPDAVADEVTFRAKVKERLGERFAAEAEHKFIRDMRELLIQKAGGVVFADDVLKRWLLMSNEETTAEAVEADYPKVIEDLKYHLVKKELMKECDLEAKNEEIEALAKRVAKSQFAQYGMLSVPDDVLTNYAKGILEKEETVKNLVNRIIDEKLSAWMKGIIMVDEKEVTAEAFGKIMEEQNKAI